MLRDVLIRVRSLFQRKAVEVELDEELRFHFEQHVDKLVKAGMTRAEATRRARLEFGGDDQIKEECREARGTYFIETFLQDLFYGARMLRKSPGFTAIAVLTLALGIGANTAIFSYVNAWIIKPLAYPQADRLMVLLAHDTKKGWTSNAVTSNADFLDYEKQNTTFEELVPWMSWFFNLTGDGPPDRVVGGMVGWNFFQTLGAQPLLGRTFLPQEAEMASSHVAILSRGLWESRFAGDPRIIGRTITLEGETYTIVGVMPANFQFSLMGVSNIWTPLALEDKVRNDRTSSWFSVFGRLKAGVTPEQAGADFAAIGTRLEKLYPQTNTNQTTLLSPMIFEIGKNEGKEQVMVCFWIVGLILLMACANVTNLMLARASRRTKEFALRGALGASRTRLVRQMLTEFLLLFSLGGAVGALFGVWGVYWIENSLPEKIRGYIINYGRGSLDMTTFAYTFGIALLCGIIFGLMPALGTSGLDINSNLKEAAGQASGGRAGIRARSVLVGGEIALAVVVLISTALLVQDFLHLYLGDIGFQPQNLMVTQLVLPSTKYKTDPQIRSFYDRVLERVRAIPGVVAADATEYAPFSDSSEAQTIAIVGRPAPEPGEEIGASITAVTPGFFQTMRTPLLRGRAIETGDGPDAPNAVVINQTLVRQQFANQDPIGMQLEVGEKHTVYTIVGVVQDVKRINLTDRPTRQIYFSAAQFPSAYMSIIARTSRLEPHVAAEIRSAVWWVDADQPVSKVRTMDDLITEQNTANRIFMQLLSFFGLLALLLGSIGIYGVIAQAVQQRIHEIGIRMALGASASDVTRMIVVQGLKLAFVGIALGLAAAMVLTRGMASMLNNLKPNDPGTFVAVAVFFAVVAMVACYIPARRGAGVDPLIALRHD
jgi:putative ABC transport system permease protein